jgi:serine/threonine protein kinase
LRLFEKEGKTLYELGQNHDQIPKLYTYFEQNRKLYLVQEFIDGQDLSLLVREAVGNGKALPF